MSNTQTELSDVLHFYIGCKVVVDQSEYNGPSQEWELTGISTSGAVRFYEVVRNGNRQSFYKTSIKPLLRPLPDMTKEEMKECGNMVYDFSGEPKLNRWRWEDFDVLLCSVQFLWLLKKGFDLFDLIPSGQAIDKTTIK